MLLCVNKSIIFFIKEITMKIIQLITFLFALSKVESFLPFSLTQMYDLRAEQDMTLARLVTSTPASTKTVEASTNITLTAQISTETSTLEPIKSVFEEYAWLDNIVQLICERLLRFIKLLIQKFIMKQDISIADFLMTVLIA